MPLFSLPLIGLQQQHTAGSHLYQNLVQQWLLTALRSLSLGPGANLRPPQRRGWRSRHAWMASSPAARRLNGNCRHSGFHDRATTCFARCPGCMKKHPIPSPCNQPRPTGQLTLQEPGPFLPSLPQHAEYCTLALMLDVGVTAVQESEREGAGEGEGERRKESGGKRADEALLQELPCSPGTSTYRHELDCILSFGRLPSSVISGASNCSGAVGRSMQGFDDNIMAVLGVFFFFCGKCQCSWDCAPRFRPDEAAGRRAWMPTVTPWLAKDGQRCREPRPVRWLSACLHMRRAELQPASPTFQRPCFCSMQYSVCHGRRLFGENLRRDALSHLWKLSQTCLPFTHLISATLVRHCCVVCDVVIKAHGLRKAVSVPYSFMHTYISTLRLSETPSSSHSLPRSGSQPTQQRQGHYRFVQLQVGIPPLLLCCIGIVGRSR